jgi:hypothetical protein
VPGFHEFSGLCNESQYKSRGILNAADVVYRPLVDSRRYSLNLSIRSASMWTPKLTYLLLCLTTVIAVFTSAIMEARGPWMVINSDFPDPGFVRSTDGTWYAFGTNGNGKRIQVARSTDFTTWTLLNKEALPTLAGWETERDHWAPDVIRRVCALVFLYLPAANQLLRLMVDMLCTIPARLKRW